MLKGKKILVTGGAGFIGSNLCERLLADGNYVVCFDNFLTGKRKNIESFLTNSNFQLLECDIREKTDCEKAVNGIDIVLHQAALGSVPRSVNDPLTTNDINITGFLNMLWASKEAGIKRFVYAASSSTYGDSSELPKVEERIGKPLSPYAVTKYVNELYAKVFSDLYGMEVIGLRYFNVFGKNQDPDGAYAAAIPKFIKTLLKHESPQIYGDGSQTRDFTYIENVIQANILAATVQNKEALNTVYNVAYGDRITLNELVQVLKELLSKYDKEVNGIELKFGSERAGEVKHSLASIEKAKKFLNYSPTHNLRKGLEEAVDWYVENLAVS